MLSPGSGWNWCPDRWSPPAAPAPCGPTRPWTPSDTANAAAAPSAPRAGNGRARSTPPPRCHRRVAAGVKPAGRGGGRCRAQCQGAANQRPGRGGGGEERAGLRGQEMGQRQEGRVRGWLGGVCHVMSGARLLPTAAVGWAGGAEAVREGGAQGCAGAGRASERVPVSLATRESRSEEESGGKRSGGDGERLRRPGGRCPPKLGCSDRPWPRKDEGSVSLCAS